VVLRVVTFIEDIDILKLHTNTIEMASALVLILSAYFVKTDHLVLNSRFEFLCGGFMVKT